jgi:hypothetical protein
MQHRIHKEASADCRERRIWVRLLGIRSAEPTRANEELLGANYSPAREELDSSPDGSRPALDSREGSGASCAVTRPRRAGEPRARAASGGGSGGVRTGRGGRRDRAAPVLGTGRAEATEGSPRPRRWRPEGERNWGVALVPPSRPRRRRGEGRRGERGPGHFPGRRG